MSLKDWFKGGTPLQLAIERGLKPGGDLVAELDELDDYTIKSKRDAQAICRALEAVDQDLGTKVKRGKSRLYKLAGLFQDAEGGSDACEHLREHGIPLLIKLARKTKTEAGFDKSEFLFVLKMLAAYGTTEGADLVIEVAQSGYASDGYLWSLVLGMFSREHPEARRVFTALSNPLPDKFLAVALLDAANRLWLEGGEMRHPFDSDQGIARLENWLRDSDPEHYSYANSATAALPFIQHPRQDELFEVAYAHPDVGVQLEAAWAAAKLDRPSGLKHLAEFCEQVNHSHRAKSYLKELGREDLVPESSQPPDFVALSEFAQWLAHPNELGGFADELEIVDHRDLRWPADGEVKHFWLIKYRVKDTTGLDHDDVNVGLVGSMTFCLFSYDLDQRHPEDAYAIHCYWELTHGDQITDSDVEGSSEYDALLQHWNGPTLESPQIAAVSELGTEIKYERRLIGVASAKINGQSGWAVLDGPESRWYAADEMPEDERAKTVLMVHLGRRLLRFAPDPDRKLFLRKQLALPPQQIKEAYEKLLAKAETDGAVSCERLLGSGGLLASHFEAYVSARHTILGGNNSSHVAETYDHLLRIARPLRETSPKLFVSFSALGENFEAYIQALLELGRQAEVVPLLDLFRPYWEHNLGYGKLAGAAFKSGQDNLSEAFCLKLKAAMEDWQRSEEMSYLAEIWHRQGKQGEACSLLLECLRKMLDDGRKAEGSDRKLFEEWFQNHRRTFLRLFPTESLQQHHLPETTLT